MKICWMGFLGTNHSWSIVGQNICRQLISQGHEVDMFSTNGDGHFPDDLRPYLKSAVKLDGLTQTQYEEIFKDLNAKLSPQYDMQLSYTALKNFDKYFSHGNVNRFGIWNYETTVIPKSFAKQHLSVDKVLPSSQFSKDIFLNNGIPENKMEVIPHGVHPERFDSLGKYSLNTKKKYKILANIAQPHVRKNIGGLLKAYGEAFTKKDDVCLVLKVASKDPKSKFEVDFKIFLSEFKSKYKNHGEIEIINHFLVDIEPLYNACDIVFTMTRAECFWMPGLEGLAAKKMVIAPNYGGQLDFMNQDNSLLIPGKVGFAGYEMQYWEPSPFAKAFNPDVGAAAEILKKAVSDYDGLMTKFLPNINATVANHTWDKVAEKIVGLTK